MLDRTEASVLSTFPTRCGTRARMDAAGTVARGEFPMRDARIAAPGETMPGAPADARYDARALRAPGRRRPGRTPLLAGRRHLLAWAA